MMRLLLQQNPVVFYLFFAIFCLVIGSLLNVIIYRLPLMLQTENIKACRFLLHLKEEKTEKLNLFFPRSFCPSCKTMIPFWHNIPILSYCLLLGRCRHCHQKISFRYPLVELITLLLSLYALHVFGMQISLVFVLFFIWLLICLCMIDFDHQILPDQLTYPLLWLGLIANTQSLFTSLTDAVLSAAGAYLFLWSLMNLFYLIRKKIGMGHGDFKLFAAFGAWFGWTQLPFILLISSLFGAVSGIIYLMATKKSSETPIPYGPFLCSAGLISLFFGQKILKWYLT